MGVACACVVIVWDGKVFYLMCGRVTVVDGLFASTRRKNALTSRRAGEMRLANQAKAIAAT